MSLSERLIERRLLSSDELDRVLQAASRSNKRRLSRLVVELGFLSEEDLLPVLRDHFDTSADVAHAIFRIRRCRSTCLPASAIFSSWRGWCR